MLVLDARGSVLHERRFGGEESDLAHAIAPAADGGFLVAGSTRSFNSSHDNDLYVLRLDRNARLTFPDE